MSEVNKIQIGGDHYRSGVQHWDYVELNGLGYLEGCATKYVSRWRKKGGKQDLEKALHYIDKLMELRPVGRENRAMWMHPSRKPTELQPPTPKQFCEANELDQLESVVIVKLSHWQCEADLILAREAVKVLIAQAELDAERKAWDRRVEPARDREG